MRLIRRLLGRFRKPASVDRDAWPDDIEWRLT
jgi:hypothetical protein